MTKTPSLFGSWPSPIKADLIAGASVAAFDPKVDGDRIYWLENRPSEGGRVVLMRRVGNAQAEEISPADMNLRTRVHEYGGAPYTVGGGRVFAVNFADQRLYEIAEGRTAHPLTPEDGNRFADIHVDLQHQRLICVRESHTEGSEPVNAIVAISLDPPHDQIVLAQGHDFFAFPALKPGGSQLAYVAWDHPNMPWDNVQLYVATLNTDGTPAQPRRLNDGIDESVMDVQWSPTGDLYFIADRSGWWNPYRWNGTDTTQLVDESAEFGGPLWSLGQRNFGFVADDCVLLSYADTAASHLALLHLADQTLEPIAHDCSGIGTVHCYPGGAILEAGFSDNTPALFRFDLESKSLSQWARPSELTIPQAFLSTAQAIEFPTANALTAHAYFYPPCNPEFAGPEGAKPPLIVKIHGGPTGQSSANLQLAIQFWTSRGFAFVDINYGGSSGYGRAYRKRLEGKWGVVDLADTVACVRYLAQQGLIDPDKVAIRGGSAGGYTTLAALAFSDVFKAGANYYGVSDLEALAKDTHKFESRYLDGLIGPYPAAKRVYEERSPIHHLEGFTQPLIVFQGSEDKVVPPNQSEMIVNVLKEKKVPVAYLLFDGEQHGFRKAENIIRSLEAELFFYGQIFGFKPADDIEPVEIENLVTA